MDGKENNFIQYKKILEEWRQSKGEEGYLSVERDLRTSLKQDPELRSTFEDVDDSWPTDPFRGKEDEIFRKFLDVCASLPEGEPVDYSRACNQFLQGLQVSQKENKDQTLPNQRQPIRRVYHADVSVQDKLWKRISIVSFEKKPQGIMSQIEIIKKISPIVYDHLLYQIEQNPPSQQTPREDTLTVEDSESLTRNMVENNSDLTSENLYQKYFRIEVAEVNWSEAGLGEMMATRNDWLHIHVLNTYNSEIKDQKKALVEAFKSKHKRFDKTSEIMVKCTEEDRKVEVLVQLKKNQSGELITLLSLKYRYSAQNKPNCQEITGFFLFQKFCPPIFDIILESLRKGEYRPRSCSRTPTASVIGKGDSESSKPSPRPEEVEEMNRKLLIIKKERDQNNGLRELIAPPPYTRMVEIMHRTESSNITSEDGSPGINSMRETGNRALELELSNKNSSPKPSIYQPNEFRPLNHNRPAVSTPGNTSSMTASTHIPESSTSEIRSSQPRLQNPVETIPQRSVSRMSDLAPVSVNNSRQPVDAPLRSDKSLLMRDPSQTDDPEDNIGMFREYCVPNINQILGVIRFDLRIESPIADFQFPVLWDDEKFIEISQTVFKKKELFLNFIKFENTNRLMFGSIKEQKRKTFACIEWEEKSASEFILIAKVAILRIVEVLAPNCLKRFCSDSIRRKLEWNRMTVLDPSIMMSDFVKSSPIDISMLKKIGISREFILKWRTENNDKVSGFDSRSILNCPPEPMDTLQIFKKMMSSCGIPLSLEVRDKLEGGHRVWRTVRLAKKAVIKAEFLDVQSRLDSREARARMDALTGLLLIRVFIKSCLVHPPDSDLIVSAILKHFK
jgi:hypothetical protein